MFECQSLQTFSVIGKLLIESRMCYCVMIRLRFDSDVSHFTNIFVFLWLLQMLFK